MTARSPMSRARRVRAHLRSKSKAEVSYVPPPARHCRRRHHCSRSMISSTFLPSPIGSRMQLLSAAKTGDELTARARVTGNYEKKGHRFVELDALVVANGRTPLAHCRHIAIYQPREQAVA